MTISFRHHETTCRVIMASRQRLPIDEFSQSLQRPHIDPWAILQNHRFAARRIQHPTWNGDPQIVVKLDDDRRFLLRPQPANDSRGAVKQRVKSISDPCRTELMSSMLMRCDIPSPRTCWKRVLT
jgi:hypothetical protein